MVKPLTKFKIVCDNSIHAPKVETIAVFTRLSKHWVMSWSNQPDGDQKIVPSTNTPWRDKDGLDALVSDPGNNQPKRRHPLRCKLCIARGNRSNVELRRYIDELFDSLSSQGLDQSSLSFLRQAQEHLLRSKAVDQ